MTEQKPTRLLIDSSVRIADLFRALDSIGLVLVSGERGLQVMTKSAREMQNLRRQR